MKRLRDAFRSSKEGKGQTPDRLRHRAANGLASLVRTKHREEASQNQPQYIQYLETVGEVAIGANERAVELISTSSKLFGVNGKDPVEVKVRSQEFEWSVGFRAGESKGASNDKLTPLVDLPPLVIDGNILPVDNVTISASTRVAGNQFKAPETTLIINSRPAPADNPEGVSADTLVINIFSDGNLVFERGNPNHKVSAENEGGAENVSKSLVMQSAPYNLIAPQEYNVYSFIDGISASIELTVGAGLHELGSESFAK